jgi:hypothetical protein
MLVVVFTWRFPHARFRGECSVSENLPRIPWLAYLAPAASQLCQCDRGFALKTEQAMRVFGSISKLATFIFEDILTNKTFTLTL